MPQAARHDRDPRGPWCLIVRLATAAVLSAMVLVACGAGPAGSPASRPSAATSIVLQAAAVPNFSHVFIVVEENTDLQTVLTSSEAPAFRTLAGQGAVAANYYAVAHPSEPNYIALIGGDVFGVNSDSLITRIDAPTIVDQLEAGNRTWKAYMEGLPAPGSLVDATPAYAKKHDPFLLFTSVLNDPSRLRRVVPLTQLNQDLAAGQAPDFSFIVPDLCHDMHDCGFSQGDAFLNTLAATIRGSGAWDGRAVLFVTFDEADGRNATAGCCGSVPGGGKVGLIAVSPLAKPGYTSQQPYNHYSLLRTVQDAWKLGPLGHSGDPGVKPLSDLFR